MRTKRMITFVTVTLWLAGSAIAGWTTVGSTTYTYDNVGIGTASPSTGAKLDVNGHLVISYVDPYIRTNSRDKHVVLSGGNGWTDTGAALVVRGANASYNPHGIDIYTGGSERVRIQSNGNMGIGTAAPAFKLDVVGSGRVSLPSSGTYTDFRINDSAGSVAFLVEKGGKVGVGTSSPDGRLTSVTPEINGKAVCGQASYTSTAFHTLPAPRTYGGYFVAEGQVRAPLGVHRIGTGIYAKGSEFAGDFDGPVRICGNVTIAKRLSDTSTETLITLGAGLDYAEGFDVSNTAEVGPGSVLVIDEENSGELKQSDTAYDTKVAGIVAGAQGLGSGVRLGGSKFDHNVALAGRVYCNVDASETGVQPGDLLTTSATPGYAMKAIDYARAQGAILGKAMEKLEKGQKAQILVLVTLQ